jgi:hypothetical protein
MTKTNGNVVVEDIGIGDIHEEKLRKISIQVKVTTLPVKKGIYWRWEAIELSTNAKIEYVACDIDCKKNPNIDLIKKNIECQNP